MHMCDMTHAYVWHDSCICVTWLMHMCDITHAYVWHDSCICVTWLVRMYNMTHTYVRHDSFIFVTWLIQICDMTHSDVWHDSFRCVTWLIQMCDMTHSYMWHDSCICVTWLVRIYDMPHTHERVLSYAGTSHVTHLNWVIPHMWMNHIPHMNTSIRTGQTQNFGLSKFWSVKILVCQIFGLLPRAHIHIHAYTYAHYRSLLQKSPRKETILNFSLLPRAHQIVLVSFHGSRHMCDMTHSYVYHDSCIHVTWLMHMCPSMDVDIGMTVQRTIKQYISLQHTTARCNTLHVAQGQPKDQRKRHSKDVATHYKTMHFTATHDDTLQHTIKPYISLQHTTTRCNEL